MEQTRRAPCSRVVYPRGIQTVSMRSEPCRKTLSECTPVNCPVPTALSHLNSGVTTS